MAIIPTVRCSRMSSSLDFYTRVLDFVLANGVDELNDPCFVALSREGDTLLLSSHIGDGKPGQAVVVMVPDVDTLFARFVARGLVPPERDSPVHHGPTDQTWGTR